jgi:hypothetical protein
MDYTRRLSVRKEARYRVTRYGFNILTQVGQRIDNIVIMAQDGRQAERRLRQLYLHCEIVNRHETPVGLLYPTTGTNAK